MKTKATDDGRQFAHLTTAANWVTNLFVALSFLTLTRVLGKPATFWLYGAVSAGAWLFAFFLVPAVKGKSLEEIEAQWCKATLPRASRRYVGTSAQRWAAAMPKYRREVESDTSKLRSDASRT